MLQPEVALAGPADVDLDFGGPVEMEAMHEDAMLSGPPQPTLSEHDFAEGVQWAVTSIMFSCLATFAGRSWNVEYHLQPQFLSHSVLFAYFQ